MQSNTFRVSNYIALHHIYEYYIGIHVAIRIVATSAILRISVHTQMILPLSSPPVVTPPC